MMLLHMTLICNSQDLTVKNCSDQETFPFVLFVSWPTAKIFHVHYSICTVLLEVRSLDVIIRLLSKRFCGCATAKSHSPSFHSILKRFSIYFKVLIIGFSPDCLMEICHANQFWNDISIQLSTFDFYAHIFFRKRIKRKILRENRIIWQHLKAT